MAEQKKSLEDLEQIYAKNKNFQYKPDLNYESLRISKEELRPKSEPMKHTQEFDTDIGLNNRNLNQNKKRDEFIEMKSFLPTAAEKMISSRYENPLSELQKLTSIWRTLILVLGIPSIVYLLLNLIATLADTLDYDLHGPISPLIEVKWEMQDTLFWNETITALMDIWGIVTYVSLVILLLRDRKAHLQNNFQEKGDFEKKISSVLAISVVLFGFVYVLGILYEIHGHEELKAMVPVVVFYMSKILVVLVIAFMFKKYKTAKYTYEDLMFEALESSDDEESGEM